MLKKLKLSLATIVLGGLLTTPTLAQDLSVPQPNVMLLVDTSGSMEGAPIEAARAAWIEADFERGPFRLPVGDDQEYIPFPGSTGRTR